MLCLSAFGYSHADEDELLIHAVEYEKIIVNWNPQGNQLARVLAYECFDCEVKNFTVSVDTLLEDEDGISLDIQQLARKVDWEGTIQTIGRDSSLIIKIMLN